ncbi:MAG: PEP-CTERM sorting domain-containing protein [Betaproteobacteria bacterium]|nr:PEP-CTERM sorting domain-containing protein [Betaproteobacteria bacterium]
MKKPLVSALFGASLLALSVGAQAVVAVVPDSGALSLAFVDHDGVFLDAGGNLAVDGMDYVQDNTIASFSDAFYSARAQTLPGVNRGEAIASAPGNPDGVALAMSAWYDKFTVSGGTGAGVADVSTSFTGTIGSSAYSEGLYAMVRLSEAQFAALPSVDPASLLGSLGSIAAMPPGSLVMFDTVDSTTNPGPLDGTLTGSVAFNYDEPFYLFSIMVLDASESGSISSFSSAEFGITPPGGSVLTSAGGYTYAAAVPEPETLGLMAAGIALVAWRLRRRRATR